MPQLTFAGPIPVIDMRSDETISAQQLALQQARRNAAQTAFQGLEQSYGREELARAVEAGSPLGEKVSELAKLAMFGDPNAPLPTREVRSSYEMPTGDVSIGGLAYGQTPTVEAPSQTVETSRTVPVLPVNPQAAFGEWVKQNPNANPMAVYGQMGSLGLLGDQHGTVRMPTDPLVTGQSKNTENYAQANAALELARQRNYETSNLLPAKTALTQAQTTTEGARQASLGAEANKRGYMEVGGSIYDIRGGVPRLVGTAPPRTANERWSSVQRGIGPNGEPVAYQVGPNGEARIVQGVTPEPKAGFDIQFDPTTGRPIRVSQGTPGGKGKDGSDLGVVAKNELEKKVISTNEALVAIDRIMADFDDQYQQYGPRFGFAASAIQEKLGIPLSPSQKENLAKFTTYKAEAYNVLNTRLNDMSGAAVTEQELNRLRQDYGDPGKGVFDGDSPTEIKAKYARLQETLALVKARWNLVLKGGIRSIEDKTLGQMDQIIQEDGRQMMAELKKASPTASEADLTAKVQQQLRTKYGF